MSHLILIALALSALAAWSTFVALWFNASGRRAERRAWATEGRAAIAAARLDGIRAARLRRRQALELFKSQWWRNGWADRDAQLAADADAVMAKVNDILGPADAVAVLGPRCGVAAEWFDAKGLN